MIALKLHCVPNIPEFQHSNWEEAPNFNLISIVTNPLNPSNIWSGNFSLKSDTKNTDKNPISVC